jgi:hypothetical protein
MYTKQSMKRVDFKNVRGMAKSSRANPRITKRTKKTHTNISQNGCHITKDHWLVPAILAISEVEFIRIAVQGQTCTKLVRPILTNSWAWWCVPVIPSYRED